MFHQTIKVAAARCRAYRMGVKKVQEPRKRWIEDAVTITKNFRAQVEKRPQQVKALEKEVCGRSQLTATQIKLLLKARRIRDQFFDNDLFADPAWDILLDAYATKLQQKQMSVSDLCLAAEVPTTTALRWIVALERKGWLERCDDPLDGRRAWIGLTQRGAAAMEGYWSAISGSIPPI